MAGLEQRNGRYNVIVRFGGQRFVRSLKTDDEEEAMSRKMRLEENIRLVESGRLQLPEGADVITFLLSDGKLSQKPVAERTLTLSQIFDEFFAAIPEGNLEATTLDGMKLHSRHLKRVLGNLHAVQQLTQEDLQKYVTKRAKERTRKGTCVGPNTIHKELVTFRTAWGWGVDNNKLHGGSPEKASGCRKQSRCLPFKRGSRSRSKSNRELARSFGTPST